MNKVMAFFICFCVYVSDSYACHPVLKCVEKTQSQVEQKQCVAWFGFVGGENISYGTRNRIYGGGLSSSNNQGQGTKFSTSNLFGSDSSVPGQKYLPVTYDCSSVSWKLSSSTATANSNSNNCQETCAGDPFTAVFSQDGKSVTVSSAKDLSHVILTFCDGTTYKFDNLNSGKSASFSKGKQISSVTVKAGCSQKVFSRECQKEDCLGVPGGSAVDSGCGCNLPAPSKGCDGKLYCENPPVVDSCGVCGGEGPKKPGCDGKLYCENPPVDDECGVCGGNNSTCLDCADIPNGTHVVNSCQECVEKSSIRESYCAEVNGYLGQINIGTILNLSSVTNTFNVSYYNMLGKKVNTVELPVKANTKRDFIVNDILGLAPNTYGTVCVTQEDISEWKGGITVYKPSDNISWGKEYDFAMYYEFSKGETDSSVVPLNLFNPFTGNPDFVANWIRISDLPGDCLNSEGTLDVYQSNSVDRFLGSKAVVLKDGSRTDISGHDILEKNHAGMAVYSPVGKSPYIMSVGRLIYNCTSDNPFGCTKFLTAINIPAQTGTIENVFGSASSLDNITWLEINNPNKEDVILDGSAGGYVIPGYGTRHLSALAVGLSGIDLFSLKGSKPLVANVMYYNLPNAIMWSNKMSKPIGPVQTVEWNSFLGQSVVIDLFNLGLAKVVTYDVFDYSGKLVLSGNVSLGSMKGDRVTLSLPADSYGTLNVHGDQVISNVLVNKNNEYVLSFIGK